MLSPETIELCRESLEATIKRLETWLDDNPLTVSAGDDFNSWAVKKQNHQASSALLDDCLAAKKRIKDGTYGKCVTCGNWIDPDRLNAYPYASRCKPCQEKVGLRVR